MTRERLLGFDHTAPASFRRFTAVEDGMILEIVTAFLLCEAILACLLWLLLADDLAAAEHKIVQAEEERDRAIDDWFRAQDFS